MGKKESSIFIRMDQSLNDRIQEQAYRLGASKSTIIRMAVVKFLEEQEQNKQLGVPVISMNDLIAKMKMIERKLNVYEKKYGILSEDFYAKTISGKLDNLIREEENSGDLDRWRDNYNAWLRLKGEYTDQLKNRETSETLRSKS